MLRHWFVLSMIPILAGCRGKEFTRVPLVKMGDSGEAKWVVAGVHTARLWAEYKGKWVGGKHADITYDVELLDGAKSVQKVECATSSCTGRVCSNASYGNGHGSGDCECEMSCTLDAPSDGTFTVRASVKKSSMTSSDDVSLILRK
jgi:hypothetical protein